MTNIQIIAQTVVELARLGVIAYGIAGARAFLIHWLDSRERLLFERRTADEIELDDNRTAGIGELA